MTRRGNDCPYVKVRCNYIENRRLRSPTLAFYGTKRQYFTNNIALE